MDLSQFLNKRVTLVLNLDKPNADGHLAEELDGLVTTVSPDGDALILKPRGSTLTMLIETKKIEPDSMKIVVEKPRELKPRALGPLSLSNARQHLLSHHWFQVGLINDMTDEHAHKVHEAIDHTGFGHTHKVEASGESGQ